MQRLLLFIIFLRSLPFLFIFWHPHIVLWQFRSPTSMWSFGICSMSLFKFLSLMGLCGGMYIEQIFISLWSIALTAIAWRSVSMLIWCWGMPFLIRIEIPPQAWFPSLCDDSVRSFWCGVGCYLWGNFLVDIILGLYSFMSCRSFSQLALIPLQFHCMRVVFWFLCSIMGLFYFSLFLF